MHRYSPAGGGNTNASNVAGGGHPRETLRTEPLYSTPQSFTSSRRALQLTPYKLKCDREPLNPRLGPAEFYPSIPNCAEESLGRDSCQNGYKEIINGIEESKEVTLTLVATNNFWTKSNIIRYKESVRKRLGVLSEALLRKRKAGQVYGVPLAGPLLAKSGCFPEQRTCSEDYRKKWIEDLSQRKKLHLLADHVPHGYRRRTLFEALIKHNVPMLRATWFIKVMYLNQVRPAAGVDKSQPKRTELWTKDFLEYAQSLLDEAFQNGTAATGAFGISSQGGEGVQGHPDNAELDMHAKWRYIMRLLQWHCADKLLCRSQVVEWALKQIQEKDAVEALELLLPVLLDSIDSLCMSQTHLRMVVDMASHWLRKLCPSETCPKPNARPLQLHVVNCLIELLRYLLVVVPDSFLALDCFPLPFVVYSATSVLCLESAQEENIPKRLQESKSLVASRPASGNDITVSDAKSLTEGHFIRESGLDPVTPRREVVISEIVELIQKRAASIAKAVSPDILHSNEGKVVQGLDKALTSGDIVIAYNCLFDGGFCHPDPFLALETAGSAYNQLNYFSANANASEFRAIQFLCEWATCSFRDSRKLLRTTEKKISAGKDMSRVYMAVSILRLRQAEKEGDFVNAVSSSGQCLQSYNCPPVYDSHFLGDMNQLKRRVNSRVSSASDSFLSPGLIHDLIVAWLDHHELHKRQGFNRVSLLLIELVNEGLFRPDAYVRRLILDGILERKATEFDVKRAAKHRRILRHLPGPPFLSMDVNKCSNPLISEAVRQYQNERRLALIGVGCNRQRKLKNNCKGSLHAGLHSDVKRELVAQIGLEGAHEEGNSLGGASDSNKQLKVRKLRQDLCRLLQLPDSCTGQQVKSFENKGHRDQKTLKRHLVASSMEKWVATPGCEECIRKKRVKSNEEKKGWVNPASLVLSIEQEDTWWSKKGSKVVNVVKLEPPIKLPKQTIRGRPKTVRKTQSLAQLANPRIEGSQGASPLQGSDHKVPCPYHQFTVAENNVVAPNDSCRASYESDLRTIGAIIKRLRLVEKRTLSRWLIKVVQNLVDGGTKPSYGVQKSAGIVGVEAGADGGSFNHWCLSEEKFVSIVYILDLSMDFQSILKFLLWLLPLAPVPVGSSAVQSGRNISGPLLKKENCCCNVSEAIILSCLRRYENVLSASNLLPLALSAGMKRASVIMSSLPSGRAVCSLLLGYVRDLLRKYGGLASMQSWEKDWRKTCDQRLGVELDALKAGDSEGFNLIGFPNCGVSDDRDDPPPQKLSGRLSRVGASLKDIVQRGLSEVIIQTIRKDRDSSNSNLSYDMGLDSLDGSHLSVQLVVAGLMDFIRQNGGGVPQADSILISGAVAAIVSNAATAALNVFETSNVAGNSPGPGTVFGPLIRRVIQIHIECLRLLKESVGERHSRAIEVALASEASSIVSSALGHIPVRAPRSQFHMSPETPEGTSAFANPDVGNSSISAAMGRATAAAAAAIVACLVVCCVLQGIASLERIVTTLRLKDGLEALHPSKHSFGSNNGNSRTIATGNTLKVDNVAEAHVYWFRVLIGDCRNVAGGLIAELLGDANLMALARLQSLMPLIILFPPAYAIFSAAIRRQQLLYITTSGREDQIFSTLVSALGDIISHDPFREACFRDTHALYLLLSSAVEESDYASLLDSPGFSNISKVEALVPLCAKLFLHSLLDRQLPSFLQLQDTSSWLHGQGEKSSFSQEIPQMQQLVQILDELQPATFHWQWMELRLLLNEQVLIEKLEVQRMPAKEAVQAVQAVAACSDVSQLSECEKSFTSLVLTRLLVRPDAAPLYSEAVHCLGRALEESLILHVKWILEGSDMLLGRKSLGQLLEAYANSKGYPVSIKHVKAWEPHHVKEYETLGCSEFQKNQGEPASPEEGEFSEEAFDSRKKDLKESSIDVSPSEVYLNSTNQFTTEKALANLVLPCLKRSSNDTCYGFAQELVKQLSNLEQQISLLARTYEKPTLLHNPVSEASTGKGQGSRRSGKSGLEGGSPGIGRRPMGSIAESSVSAAALRSSLWLRLQFLLPLLPIIYSDRDSTPRNMRLTLAPVLLRLLGTRIVQEEEEHFSFVHLKQSIPSKDLKWRAAAASASACALAGEELFDRLLSVVYALLSGSWAVWLKPRSSGKIITKPPREVPPFEKEAAERLQVELDHMQLSNSVRKRLQAAMPHFPPIPIPTILAGPQLHSVAVASVQSNTPIGTGTSQKQQPMLENLIGRIKTPPFHEPELELDAWTLLEDGTYSLGFGSGNAGGTSTETGNARACSWLKGAVRVRRTSMTYVAAVDDT